MQDMIHTTPEKECTNCGSMVDGNFCKNCGQKTADHKQTIAYLILHLILDIVHYDSRLVRTLKLLLTKPGFLSVEYMKGVRQKYIDPFRFYLFTSAVIFVVFIALEKHQETITKISDPELIHAIDSTRVALQNDTAFRARLNQYQYIFKIRDIKGKKIEILNVSEMLKHGEAYYDSVQNTLSPDRRSSGYKRYKEKKLAKAYELYDTAPYNLYRKREQLINLIMPKSFLISMPIFIIGLLLLYIKKRKNYHSAYQVVFALHLFTTIWFFIMLDSIVSYIFEHTGLENIETWFSGSIFLGLIPYLYFSLLRFYNERWWVTIIKTLLLVVVFSYCYIQIIFVLREYLLLSLTSIQA
jgi:hypothetical protein